VFLMSDAFRALDTRVSRRWDWSASTILFISHAWDPARDGAEALAGRRLVKALLEAGARVHVLSAARADDEFRHDNYEGTVVPCAPLPLNKVARAWRMVRLTIPEDEGPWVSGAVAAGVRVLSSLPADTIIYGRSMPGSSNIVAWHLARMSGLPWIAHFSDEWPSIGPLSNGRGWLAPYKWPLFRFWRQRIIRDADALTFTNPLQAKDILSGDARELAKSFVVSHLPSGATRANQTPQYDFFRIVHTGNIYYGRTSASLMQGLRLFLDRTPAARGPVRFTQAGWDTGDLPAWKERCGLGDVVQCVGRMNEHDMVRLIDTASLLIAVDFANQKSTTLPLKTPDYVNAGRPILAITAPSTSLERLFDADGAGLTAYSPEQVAERIAAVFDAWQQRRLDAFLPKPAAIASFSCARVLAELAAAFDVAGRARRAAEGHAPRGVDLRREETTP
jgi:hypothetical protein